MKPYTFEKRDGPAGKCRRRWRVIQGQAGAKPWECRKAPTPTRSTYSGMHITLYSEVFAAPQLLRCETRINCRPTTPVLLIFDPT
jgi:hypothetical protein